MAEQDRTAQKDSESTENFMFARFLDQPERESVHESAEWFTEEEYQLYKQAREALLTEYGC